MRLRFVTVCVLLGSTAFGLALGASGCDPYSPELIDVPFACASKEPRCPNGFECDTDPTQPKQMCKRKGGVSSDGGGPDAAPATSCDGPPDRDFEPNESTAAAIQLPSSHYVVNMVGICDQDDADMYWLNINNGQRLVLRLDFTHTAGDLTLTLLSSSAQQLRFSDASSVSNNFESIDFPVSVTDKYYIKVKGKDPAVRNTYVLTVDPM